jgi:hypothetical protein
VRWEASIVRVASRPDLLFGGEKLIICCVEGVQMEDWPEISSAEDEESAEGLPLTGKTSKSMTNSFNINTLRPRRHASALSPLPFIN